MKADSYAYRDRRNRKRDFRRLWITRINAAARLNGMTYGTFMHGLKLAGDRARPQGPRRHRRARPRDVPPICRGRPRGVGSRCVATPADTKPHRAPLPLRTAPFLCPNRTARSPAVITSHHNPLLKEIRRLERAARARALRGRGRGPARRGAGGAGWDPVHAAARRGRGLRGGAGQGQRARGRARARSASTRSAGAARGPALRGAVGRQGPGQRRDRPARRAGLRRGVRRASGPGTADPYGPKAVRASMGAIFTVPVARVAAVDELPGDDRRAGRPRGRPAARPAARRRRSSSAPSAPGCPRTCVDACDRARAHPDRQRVAERRDGRHDRPLRVD